jgi:hypothetical protein
MIESHGDKFKDRKLSFDLNFVAETDIDKLLSDLTIRGFVFKQVKVGGFEDA